PAADRPGAERNARHFERCAGNGGAFHRDFSGFSLTSHGSYSFASGRRIRSPDATASCTPDVAMPAIARLSRIAVIGPFLLRTFGDALESATQQPRGVSVGLDVFRPRRGCAGALAALRLAPPNAQLFRHPHQIGQRARGHFPHDMTAMNLDRNLAQ